MQIVGPFTSDQAMSALPGSAVTAGLHRLAKATHADLSECPEPHFQHVLRQEVQALLALRLGGRPPVPAWAKGQRLGARKASGSGISSLARLQTAEGQACMHACMKESDAK